MIGETIAHYRITAKIGEGGMGEVYRARDTKLKRDVALKVLPEAFARDPERMVRFQREAEVLASLNHPNIAAIYGIEQDTLVMELVEGESPKGPLSFDDAWKIGAQIAAALEYAHDRGIVHRDLKPANVKIAPDGTVKLLDFGLAKAFSGQKDGSPASGENSPTLTIGATEIGVILGTAAYMSPEQARGKQVDKRADIWAFGVLMYELLTGQRPFKGDDVSETLASVLTKEPDLNKVPLKVRRLLRRCLEKDPKKRLRDIGEAAFLLDDAPTDAAPSSSRLGWVAGVLAVALVILGGLYWRAMRLVERPLQPLMRLSIDLGPDAVPGQFTTTAISPDGSRLVFPIKSSDGKQMLATRLLSETKPAPLSGTDNGRDPFFSPDGKWIGYFADGKMKKISLQGGVPVALCDAPNARGASWGDDGNIVAALNTRGAISRVPTEGGPPQPVTKLQGALSYTWPQPLPGSKSILFTFSLSSSASENASIATVSLTTGEVKILVHGGYFGRYLPSGDSTGHLLYVHEGVLFGVPFDPVRLELRGEAVPLLEDLASDLTSGAGQFSFSGTGNFVYRTGKVSAQSWPVLLLDSTGKTLPLIATPGFYVDPRFSPDGKRLAMMQAAGKNRGISVYDWQRDTMARLTFDTDTQETTYPMWSPDGKHIVFHFRSAGGSGLGWMRADGARETEHLLDRKNLVFPYSFFPDGRRLAYLEVDPDSRRADLWTLALDVTDADHPKPGKPELFLRTPSDERFPAVSPDGRWIAYQSNESGRDDVYVRPFPGPGGKWQVSNAGGQFPVWSRNSRELFFENLENRIMVTDYEATSESFVPGKPRVWSSQQLHDLGRTNLNYDLAPDGKRVAIIPELKVAAEEKGNIHVNFLENFFDELRRRAPATK